jgi:AraC-like DNA-binding protein
MGAPSLWFLMPVGFFCMLGFVVSLILFFYNKDQSFSPRVLAGLLFCLSVALFGYLLYVSREYRRFPHLYRAPVFMTLSTAPLLYIYVRSSLEQAFWFKKWDILLFLPAALYTAQFIPFYMLPASEKLHYIEKAFENKSFGAREPEGLLPPGIGFVLRMGYSLFITLLTSVLIFRWRNSDKRQLLQIRQNKEIFDWLYYLTVILFFTFLVLGIGHLFQLSGVFEKYRLPTLVVTFTILFITLYLLFKPNILYGLQGWLPLTVPSSDQPPKHDVPDKDLPGTKRQLISAEQAMVYRQTIEQHFCAQQPYLKQQYTIKDLSEEVNIPSYLLSAFVNQEYGKNFSEFVNDNRVNYLLQLAEKEPEQLQKFTLEVVGQNCGFKSRSSFIAAVKRKTGKTPSEIFSKN